MRRAVILNEPVIWSRTSNILSVVLILFFLALLICIPMSVFMKMILFCLVAIAIIPAMYYAPMSLTLTGRVLGIRRLFTTRRIPVCDIVNVKPCTPASVGYKVCGSGGFLGYCGWWRSFAEGTYFSYVGRYDEAFFIELKSGRKYLLSCRNSSAMMEAIKRLISNSN